MFNKRFYAAALASVMAVSLLAGCGSTSDSASESTSEASTEASTEAAETKTYAADAYLSGITASDYVTLPDYDTIPVEMSDPRDDVTDETVEATIQSNLSADATLTEVTDRDTVEEGDIVNIDYVGKLNGEAFDGGTASGYDLEIGSDSFIDGFEDGIIGMKKGETKTLTLTFPENYGNSDLAGQETTFDVTVNKIQTETAAELTDDWVADQGIENVTNVAEYNDYVRNDLLETAQSTYESNLQDEAAEYVYSNATFLQDPPADMVDRLYDSMASQYETYASYYGVELDEFLETIGTSTDEMRSYAEDNARYYVCMQAVADANDLNYTDDELETAVSDLAASYGYDDAASFEATVGEDVIREYLTMQRVAEFLAGKAVVTTPSEDAADTTTEAAEAATETTTEAAAE